MSDAEATRREFTLQARRMTAGRTFNAAEAVEPFVRLLGAPLPERVLDLACGPGIVTAALAAAGTAVVAFDLTDEMLAMARRRCADAGLGRVAFERGEAESLPFASGSFDGAVTRLSLHHFADPRAALAELRRTLRPGGRLVVGDIVASADPATAGLHDALETLRDPTHRRLLPETELVASLESAGFRIETLERWENRKTFSEWAAVVADARSVQPLRDVMRALAHAGVDVGTDLAAVGDEVEFTHHWRFVGAIAA